ncbi:hypothetical protein K437DRAFT_75310 [Tilletiaria anomala UBC 951]|uniref:Uncharacterized protein n=1 Tax=Tilletiaria anomala (strain ATCC 24038 / CBS 436.72 / UBC 951) TaxID=1037660 RepID=A0A066V2B0_TILAU|nr:uncharacterized protein K437DRAFT_75310 [Tilletiaria anomala UBC 951]KDN35606.1 hypothetical protein K437DRAFT_75310 [Tilletiaria anomala UBC 951]
MPCAVQLEYRESCFSKGGTQCELFIERFQNLDQPTLNQEKTATTAGQTLRDSRCAQQGLVVASRAFKRTCLEEFPDELLIAIAHQRLPRRLHRITVSLSKYDAPERVRTDALTTNRFTP